MRDEPQDLPPNVTTIRPIPKASVGYALGLALHRHALLDLEYHAALTDLSEADLRAISAEFASRTGLPIVPYAARLESGEPTVAIGGVGKC